MDICDDCKGPSDLESEITSAIKEMNNTKAVGVDNINQSIRAFRDHFLKIVRQRQGRLSS